MTHERALQKARKLAEDLRAKGFGVANGLCDGSQSYKSILAQARRRELQQLSSPNGQSNFNYVIACDSFEFEKPCQLSSACTTKGKAMMRVLKPLQTGPQPARAKGLCYQSRAELGFSSAEKGGYQPER
jgi:hypothetical protein